jgi:hypothetical protein
MITRRAFLGTVGAAAALPVLRQNASTEWGSPVFDLHFHLRQQAASNLAHLDGAGVTKANARRSPRSGEGAAIHGAWTFYLVQQR